MEHTAIFEEQVAFTPKDMRKQVESIDNVLLEKLQGRLEGRGSCYGGAYTQAAPLAGAAAQAQAPPAFLASAHAGGVAEAA